MLVLTRRPDSGDQSVVTVGADIEVKVIEVRGDQVRLGVTAPGDVKVHRKEIWLQLREAETEQEGLT